MDFTAYSSTANPSMVTCDFAIGCSMGAAATKGFPTGYAWDFTLANDSVIRIVGGVVNEGGTPSFTAVVRSRQVSADLLIVTNISAISNSHGYGPLFDGSSNSNDIAFQTDSGTTAGISKKLSGTVAAGEPMENYVSATDTLVRYAGGNFYGYSPVAQTAGVVPAIRRNVGNGKGGVRALLASVPNTGYRLVPVAGTPGYFTAPTPNGVGSLNAFATATHSSGTPSTGLIDLDPTSSAAVTPTATSPTLGAAAQLAQVTNDAEIYLDVTTAGQLTVAIGPTSGVANTIFSAAAAAVGLISFRLPAGWYVAVTTSSTAAWTATAITC